MASPKLRWSSVICVGFYLSVSILAQAQTPQRVSNRDQLASAFVSPKVLGERNKFIQAVFAPSLCIAMNSVQETELLELNKPIEKELGGGQSHAYRLRLTAGDFVDLVVDQRGIDVVLVLFAPDGKKLFEVDSPNGSRGPEPLAFIADIPGDYRIDVRSLEKDAKAGKYEIKINDLHAAEPNDRNFVAAKNLLSEGLNLANQREPESKAKAIEKYEEATRLFRLMEDKKRKARGFREVAGRYLSVGKDQEGVELLKEAALLFEEIGLKREAAIAFKDAGDSAEGTEALQYFEKSLALSESIGDKNMVARVLGNMGSAYKDLGKMERALDLLQRSVSLGNELGDKEIEATGLGNIGTVHALQGRGLEALANYQKAYVLEEALGNKLGMAFNLNNMAIVRAQLGNASDAVELLEKALALNESIGNKRGASVELYNLGNFAKGDGNNIKAMEYYHRSLAISEALGAKGNMAGALINMADLYLDQGNYALALNDARRALELFGDSGYGAIVALIGIGEVYESQGNASEALVYYQKALTKFEASDLKNEVATTLTHIGNAYLAQQDISQAEIYFQRALKASEATDNKITLAENALKGIAKVNLLRKNYALALEFANRNNDWQSYVIAARAYQGLKEPQRAREKYEAAISNIETLRSQVAGGEEEQQRFMEGKVQPYQELIALLVGEGKMDQALAYAERSKGRVLLDVLNNGRTNISKSMTTEERVQERKLNSELVALNSEIVKESQRPEVDQKRLADLRSRQERTRLDYEAFRAKLYSAHPNLKMHRGELQPFSLQQTSTLLPDEKSGLLEFVVGEERSYLFVITKGIPGKSNDLNLKVYPIEIDQKDLQAQVDAYRQKIAKGDLDFQTPARELYDLLLRPAHDQILNKTSLVIVPDGVLWDLPFQALRSSPQRYVIEDQAISYAPSLTVLREVSRSRKQKANSAELTLLGFGNPAIGAQSKDRVKAVFMDETLEPLPEAEKQVTALAELYGATRSKVYTGADAREGRVKTEAPAYRVIQFATHGILDSTSPMYSHLVLSQKADDPNEDGLLEAWEVMDLDLKADLVVLAACETARGRIGAGEGMIGMALAFFVAGSPTTVASQWKVESASTTQLMLEFHRNLRANSSGGPMSKAKALQLAAVKLLKTPEYKHPFYWAGFVLLGDGF